MYVYIYIYSCKHNGFFREGVWHHSIFVSRRNVKDHNTRLPEILYNLPQRFSITVLATLWRFSTAWYGTVRHGSVRYGTAQFGSVAFPPQFSTAIEWAGLFTRRYNCAASTAVTSS